MHPYKFHSSSPNLQSPSMSLMVLQLAVFYTACALQCLPAAWWCKSASRKIWRRCGEDVPKRGCAVGGDRGGTQDVGRRQCSMMAMPAKRFTCATLP